MSTNDIILICVVGTILLLWAIAGIAIMITIYRASNEEELYQESDASEEI